MLLEHWRPHGSSDPLTSGFRNGSPLWGRTPDPVSRGEERCSGPTRSRWTDKDCRSEHPTSVKHKCIFTVLQLGVISPKWSHETCSLKLTVKHQVYRETPAEGVVCLDAPMIVRQSSVRTFVRRRGNLSPSAATARLLTGMWRITRRTHPSVPLAANQRNIQDYYL